jgi:hypothetical protein
MAYWRRVLQAQAILDVRYKEVVADLEGQALWIVAYCGLSWDDHKTDRPVRTVSATQVRQPIYKIAVSRWRVYEERLGPLLHALEIAEPAAGSRVTACSGRVRRINNNVKAHFIVQCIIALRKNAQGSGSKLALPKLQATRVFCFSLSSNSARYPQCRDQHESIAS